MPYYDDDDALFLGFAEQKGIGFKKLRELGGIESIASQLRSGALLKDVEDPDPMLPSPIEQLESVGYKLISQLHDAGVQLIREGQPAYPKRLLHLPKQIRPLWIFARGNLAVLDDCPVAVVGTRSPGEVGRFLTEYAVSACASLQMPVISGLAKGIDGIAHEWCVRLNHKTISVLGTGILRPYPTAHLDLAEKIVESGGLLLSEYMPFSEPKGEHFVWRNRIQAALAKSLIAPEWRPQSGTAHTVRFAKDLGRPTINLRLYGVMSGHDRGPADHSFEIPGQGLELESLLLSSQSYSTPEMKVAEDDERWADNKQGALWR